MRGDSRDCTHCRPAYVTAGGCKKMRFRGLLTFGQQAAIFFGPTRPGSAGRRGRIERPRRPPSCRKAVLRQSRHVGAERRSDARRPDGGAAAVDPTAAISGNGGGRPSTESMDIRYRKSLDARHIRSEAARTANHEPCDGNCRCGVRRCPDRLPALPPGYRRRAAAVTMTCDAARSRRSARPGGAVIACDRAACATGPRSIRRSPRRAAPAPPPAARRRAAARGR